MRVVLISAILSICVLQTFAQKARVQKFQVPLMGTVNLLEVEDKYNAQVFSLEMPSPDADVEKVKLMQAKQRSAELFPRQRTNISLKTTTALPPVVDIAYVADTFTGIPPDNDMAISTSNRSISVVNSTIAVHNSLTGQMLSRKGLYNFSLPVGLTNSGVSTNHYRFDPKVMYDPQADRFICVMLNSVNEYNWIVLAFSQTNDPLGSWNFYKFYGNYTGDTTWFDYPSIAMTPNEFFLTGNKIQFNTSWQAGFRQTLIYQINKQSGYNGDSLLTYQIWDSIGHDGKNIRNLYPVKSGGSIYGPEQYFLSNRNFDVQNDTVFLVKVSDTIGSANSTLTVTPLVSNLIYGVPPEGRQMDTSLTLATNDGRVLGAFREGNEIQFTSTTVHPVSGSSAVYHGIISNFATAPVLQAQYFGVDTMDFGYPNLSFAGNISGSNHSIISFNYTGPNIHPGMAGIFYDGSQYSDMVIIKKGDSIIRQLSGKSQRWGDYMGSQLDWNAQGVVWVEGIFGRKDRKYGNYIAKLISPYFTGIEETNHHPSTTGTLFPNPAFEFVSFEFEVKEEGNLSFAIYDIQGRKVDEVLLQKCKAGRNLIQFNIGSLTAGIYFLKAQNNEGREVMVKRLVKQ